MRTIQTSNKVVDKFGAGEHGFGAGNPSAGVLATFLSPEWCDGVQQEIINVIKAGGLVPSGGALNQMLVALQALFRSEAQVAAAIAAAVPTAAVMAFLRSAAPAGWLECDGAAVSRVTYAGLFAVVGTSYGAGDGSTTFNLPDLRAEFLRGWDHGRGVDAARALGSSQLDAVQNIVGSFGADDRAATLADGAFQTGAPSGAFGSEGTAVGNPITFDASRVARTAAETRPRNVAVLYCIKA